MARLCKYYEHAKTVFESRWKYKKQLSRLSHLAATQSTKTRTWIWSIKRYQQQVCRCFSHKWEWGRGGVVFKRKAKNGAKDFLQQMQFLSKRHKQQRFTYLNKRKQNGNIESSRFVQMWGIHYNPTLSQTSSLSLRQFNDISQYH